MANEIKPLSSMSDEELMAEYNKANRPISNLSDKELLAEYEKFSLSEAKVENEAADISPFARAFVKNLSGNEEEQASKLQEMYPNLQVKLIDGEVVAKKPNETSFKKLDPSGWKNLDPREIAQDITDVAWELGSGAASTAAGAAAGLAGGAGSFGIGALPSAIAASAATSGAAEALRQGLGKLVGAKKEFEGGEVGKEAFFGALGPLAFGSGATGGQIAKKVMEPGVLGEVLGKFGGTAKEAGGVTAEKIARATTKLAESQRGVLGRISDKTLSVISGAAPQKTLENAVKEVSPKVIEQVSGAGLDIDKTLPFTKQEIALALKEQGKLEGFGDVAANTIFDKINQNQKELQQQFASGLQSVGQKFNIAPLYKPFEDIIEATKDSPIPAVRKKALAATKVLNEYFGAKFDLGGVKHVYNKSGDRLKLKSVQPGGSHRGPIFDAKGNPIERRLARSGKSLEVSAEQAMEINNALNGFLDYTKSPIALDRMAPAEKQLRGVMADAKSKLQDQIYDALEKAGSPKLRELYAENKEFLRTVGPKFLTPEKAVQTLNNFNSPSNQVLKERLLRFDQKNNTNLTELADLADVTKYFGDPSLEAVSSGGATSTGKILRAGEILGTGAWAAGVASGITGVAPAAAQAGRAAGGILSSPAAVGAYLRGKTAVRRKAEQLGAGELLRQLSRAKQALPMSLQPAISATGAYQTGLMGEALPLAGQIPISAWQLLMGGNE